MNSYLREVAYRFSQEVSEYDRHKPRKNRKQIRDAYMTYALQEFSAYLENFMKSDSGDQLLDAMQRRYEKPITYVGVRYGASGERVTKW
jgi:hypothetical protein